MRNQDELIEKAQTVPRALADFKRFKTASDQLESLHSRKGNLTMELLFESLPDHERVNTIDRAIDKADSIVNASLLTLNEELK